MNSDLIEVARTLKMPLPRGKSAFLWGPRKTGKSTFLHQHFPESAWFDFHDTDLFFEASKRPAAVREKILALGEKTLKYPVILDEIQKVPAVLDEVHRLAENHRMAFVLCGSSARKLKRGQANMLGGRAWKFHLHPLTWAELDDSSEGFDLLRAMNQGLIPAHYLEENADRSLRAYIHDYLREEIMAEGLSRNIPAFARFLDAAAFSQGEILNYSNIARDCGIDSKSVREYFQILEDTLVGDRIEPFVKTRRRDILIKAPKFYLFDVGVAGSLARRRIGEAKGQEFGRAFEHFIYMELAAQRHYSESDFPIRYWRTLSGLEVDFVLGDGETAIEVKGTSRVDARDLHALSEFRGQTKVRHAIVVCQERVPRKVGEIEILPWSIFLERLWDGNYLPGMK